MPCAVPYFLFLWIGSDRYSARTWSIALVVLPVSISAGNSARGIRSVPLQILWGQVRYGILHKGPGTQVFRAPLTSSSWASCMKLYLKST